MQGNLIDEAETESLFHEIRTKFITLYLVGCGDSTHRCRASGTKFSQKFILQTVGVNFVCLLLKSIIVASD